MCRRYVDPVVTDVAAALESGETVLLVTHRHADRDSLGAAIGLRALLGRGTVCTPDGVAGPARSLLEVMDSGSVTDPCLDAYDTVVVLDAPSTERIAPVSPEGPILIDHHEPADLADRASAQLLDTDAGATAELVARLADEADWRLTPEAALPLLVGLLDDTGFLKGANSRSVETAVRLVGSLGDRASDLPVLVDRSPAGGERMARTLGTLRATGYRAGNLTVAITRVGGHETAAAHALRDAGVDLAVVCSERPGGLRVTARASESFTDRINLGGELLPALAGEFGGDGGGHEGAGVAHLDGGTPSAVEEFLIGWIEGDSGITFGKVA